MEGDCEKSDVDGGIDIVELNDSRHSTSFHVSKKYFPHIIGYKQQNKNKIEDDTKTELKIPGLNQDGDITILGLSVAGVKLAKQRIDEIVVSTRMKQKPTHFVSIPMNKPDIMENFTRFQETVLAECQNRGLEESIFVKSNKIHLTVGVTSLTDDEERILASNLLKEVKDKVIMPLLQEHLPFKIRVKGLDHMGNDSKHIHVLYAKVEEHDSTPGVLQQLADNIVDFYSRRGFMHKNEFGRDGVKLHVTLINTRHRNNPGTESGSQDVRKNYRRTSFDGTDILDRFGDFEFGVLEVTEFHLSHMGAIGPDGYYEPTCKISIC